MIKSIVILLVATMSMLSAPAEAISKRALRVIDGDTIQYGAAKVRLVGFDTPETHAPMAKCAGEIALGLQAKARLQSIVDSSVMTVRYKKGKDKYGRTLGYLYANGKDVGPTLIAEGLAHPYLGGKKQSWCASVPMPTPAPLARSKE